MSRPLLLALSCLLALVTLSSTSVADIILEYNTAASTTNSTLNAVNVNSTVTADSLATGGGLTANTGGTWNWRNFESGNASFADAVADGDTWTWGFDVSEDAVIDLTTLNIRVDRSGNGPPNFEIQASINGGAATSLLTVAGLSESGQNFSVDISSLDSLKQGDSIVFTLGGFGAATSAGTFDLETFSGETFGLQLNGSVAVPEPATLGTLVGLAGFAFLRSRRKKRNTAEQVSDQ